ncbi:hypothetical protein E2562_032038 [Oryza meyeriana var. granulata]|uniref:DUF868 domain-containing protein n=1 Tax=Oryza meyeriana var. granulata TaxID=110450 RepID=A0A6G1FEX0_9ORYZ|nr:hypothetical protein E2562_032038 [Oryza meyeriana var. granulata]
MHKRSKSCEPSSEMDEHHGGNNGATTCDDSACGRVAAPSTTTAQCSTVSVYRAKINGVPRLITVVWNKNLINQSFTISIDRHSAGATAHGGAGGGGDDGPLSHKVELKPWPFWSKKGLKTLDVDGDRLDIFWDLRSAKFTASSPEPAGGYYVALVSQEEVVLLLGDGKKDAFKRTKSRPSLEDAVLVCRRESVFGKRSFAARGPLDTTAATAARKDHEIVVDSALAGGREPEMRITVDGVVLVHVKSLQWKFRGNETVIVDQSPVQVLWDVHDWIFAAGPALQAVFIFKPGAPAEVGDTGGEHGYGILGDAADYSFFLHAWKTE